MICSIVLLYRVPSGARYIFPKTNPNRKSDINTEQHNTIDENSKSKAIKNRIKAKDVAVQRTL